MAPPAPAAIDLAVARRVLRIEARAVAELVDRVDERLSSAVEHLTNCRGRVIVTGMGKSGLIARKIAATLSSTGTPAHFLHPAEALHGDLGAIQPDDVVVPLSQSGETPEVLRLVERILKAKAADPAADTSADEAEIDRLVYALYGLTEDEVTAVERALGLIHQTDEEEDAALLRAMEEANINDPNDFVSLDEVLEILRAPDEC